MPMHDWTRVPAEIFHAFHHHWITQIGRALNRGLLPADYYALPEQQAAEVGPEVLALPIPYAVVVRHVNEDRIVALLEIVSPRTKASRHNLREFVDKACELFSRRIHLTLVDPLPPGPHDPNGIHAAIWEEVENKSFELPKYRPLTLAAYVCGLTTQAYIESFAVGDILPDMPLFLGEEVYVAMPLEATYQIGFADMPQRWRKVLETAV